MRKRRIGSSSVADIVKNTGTWKVTLPDIQVGSDIIGAYSTILGHNKFNTRNFFKILADQGYSTKAIRLQEHGDSNIVTGAMGWSQYVDYIGKISAEYFLESIDAGIESQKRN